MDVDDENRLIIDEDDGQDGVPFQEVKHKNSKQKRPSEDSSSDEMESIRKAYKKGRNEELVLYMQGTTKILTSCNPVSIQKSISEQVQPIKNIERAGRSLRIFCNNEKQKNQLMKVKIVADIEVTCSEPRIKTNTVRTAKVVVLGVPLDMDPEVIVKAADAVTGKRLKKKLNGQLIDTTCVLLEYDDTAKITEYVYVMWRRFSVRPYHAEPIRCYVCQGLGHTSKKCVKEQPTCSKCAGEHKFSDCPNTYTKCINCKGDHAAISRECPKYLEVKETLNLVHSERMSYKEALLKYRSNSAMKENTAQKQLNTAAQTSTGTEINNCNPATEKTNESLPENTAGEPEHVTVVTTTEPKVVQETNSDNQKTDKVAETDEKLSMSSFLKFIIKFMCLTKKCQDITTLGEEVLKLATDCFGESLANEISAMMC
jgi:hypothetical protein